MFKWIDHVTIAVNSLKQAIPTYEKLGLKLDRRAQMTSQRVDQALFNFGSGRFLSRRDEGLYPIALAVDDVSETTKTFRGQGIRTIPLPKGIANRTSGLPLPPLASP